MMSYLVFADDNSLNGSILGTSQADITVSDETNTVKESIPDFTEDTVAGARYWLTGCVKIVGETFSYVPVNRFSREIPSVPYKLFCDNLLKNAVATTSEPFCKNVDLNIADHGLGREATGPGCVCSAEEYKYRSCLHNLLLLGVMDVEDQQDSVYIIFVYHYGSTRE
jgi:hypothetical protein